MMSCSAFSFVPGVPGMCMCQGSKEVIRTRAQRSISVVRLTPGRRDKVPGCGTAHLNLGLGSGKSGGGLVGLGTHQGAELVSLTPRIGVSQEPCHSRAHRSPSETAKQMCGGPVRGSRGGAAVGNSPDDSQESWMQEPQQRRLLC